MNSGPTGDSPSPFARYLIAKQSLDDRSLHPRVWTALGASAPPISVLDIGCGTGASFRRMLTGGMLGSGGFESAARYTGVDRDPELVQLGIESIYTLLENNGFQIALDGVGQLSARKGPSTLEIELITADVFEFARNAAGLRQWSILTAHAFLDLFEADQVLNAFWPLLAPGGLAYFSMNFDDLTVIEPASSIPDDARVLQIYHAAMYRPQWGGADRRGRSGRALFESLRSRGGRTIDAAPSDWIIFGRNGGYTEDEQIVLDFLLQHIAAVVRDTREIDDSQIDAWLAERLAQVERGVLIYIAHQLDVLAAK